MAHLTDIECLVAERFGVGESPLWDGTRNRLYWSDNTTGDVHAIDLASRQRHLWRFDTLIGSLGLCRSGRLLVAAGDTVRFLDPDSGASDILARIELPSQVMKFNDGKVGPDGAFWVGTMAIRAEPRPAVASLYRIAPDGRIEEKVKGGIRVSNGLAWSADQRTLYHSDSQGLWIDAWDFEAATGAIANRRRLRTHTREFGFPDGAACDVEGAYWSAGFSACRFNRIAPDGSFIEALPVPAACSMPCFGGGDMKTLFFTSLSTHVTPEEVADAPLTGGVFMARSSVAGAPVARFSD